MNHIRILPIEMNKMVKLRIIIIIICLAFFVPIVQAKKDTIRIGVKTVGSLTVNGNEYPAKLTAVLRMTQSTEQLWIGKGKASLQITFPRKTMSIPIKLSEITYDSYSNNILLNSNRDLEGSYSVEMDENNISMFLDISIILKDGTVFELQYSGTGVNAMGVGTPSSSPPPMTSGAVNGSVFGS